MVWAKPAPPWVSILHTLWVWGMNFKSIKLLNKHYEWVLVILNSYLIPKSYEPNTWFSLKKCLFPYLSNFTIIFLCFFWLTELLRIPIKKGVAFCTKYQVVSIIFHIFWIKIMNFAFLLILNFLLESNGSK